MRLNQQYIPIGDLKAETWLNTHFPEDIPLRISTKGTFYSNYCEDLLEMDTSNVVANRVSLSRDGLFHLLPESLFVNDNRLLDPKQKNKPFAPEKEQILNFFAPFDTEFFQVCLGLDKMVGDMESSMVDDLLKSLYDIDIQDVQNELIRKAAPLLLQASEIRGDYVLIARLMAAITGFRTNIDPVLRTFRTITGEKHSRTVARIVFHIPDLNNQEYLQRYSELEEFVAFMTEWFFPVDQDFEYKIKDEHHPFVLDGSITLDYNTYL